MSPKELGVRAKIIRALVTALGFLFKICFGWLGWLLSRSYRRQFETEVRRELYFLFEDQAARIVPSKDSAVAMVIIVEFGNVRLKIARHRGEDYFDLASIFAPDQWEPFKLIVKGITRWGSSAASFVFNLRDFAPILKESMPFLEEALSKENWHATWSNAIEAENAGVSEATSRAREKGVEPVFYSPS